jgi:hypothetical protein
MSIDFKGTGYINIGNVPELNFAGTAPFSVCVWFKVNTLGIVHSMITKYGSSGNRQWAVYIDNTAFRLLREISPFTLSSSPITTNVWYCGCTIYDGVNGYVYLNGILQNTQLTWGSIPDVATSVYISSDQASPSTRALRGEMADLKVFNRALTQEEVIILYKGRSKRGLVTNGLIGHWPLDGKSGQICTGLVIKDIQNKYQGTFINNGEFTANDILRVGGE